MRTRSRTEKYEETTQKKRREAQKDSAGEQHFALQPPGGNQVDGLPPASSFTIYYCS